MSKSVMRYPPHTLVPHDAELVLASDYDALAARLAEVESERATLVSVVASARERAEHAEARLAEVQDKLSIALAANHDLRDERDSLQNRLADPCKTYDKDGRLLTVCHRLAEAERLLRKWLDGSRMDGWDAHEAWQEVSDFLTPDSANPVVHAQHSETGRVWSGPAGAVPTGYVVMCTDAEYAAQVAAADKSSEQR